MQVKDALITRRAIFGSRTSPGPVKVMNTIILESKPGREQCHGQGTERFMWDCYKCVTHGGGTHLNVSAMSARFRHPTRRPGSFQALTLLHPCGPAV
ncbi:hypothetical protein SERLA73DRAFT_191535 [Serpula lacrymans var. lacrymans S7.3]|uniref:Uncharacterized protein n=2 Tax=Serpula lacrymans var. lacrymans TaxID=341189 RepID=F8QHR9_SERL3|nr:uncharacterized protein SERLADRAFT_463873 [Serpula lacrymans var. lacrymans S7.9]XP_007316809.1 uncharacterized protein SERLADRAFT_463875 [Serpula lacrymans var. lacrymans S7.9]EGN92181.1 hypothetical protein SERLA73DRAFT_191535 [Serpula lacrymans var. lacrymans S7.3]EGO26634.1 hypothetical protein SERLADRAFT_463873 [Serpula lacrymans var. lacrymans S7.9]EGO26636.1 hypothetical protein SERLADRAFT_463875 [Serpula lacrymans var. lacrymans S7.9]